MQIPSMIQIRELALIQPHGSADTEDVSNTKEYGAQWLQMQNEISGARYDTHVLAQKMKQQVRKNK